MGSIFTLSRSPLSKSSSPEFLSHDKAGLLVIKPESVESEQSEISAYRTIRFATQDLFMYHVQTTTTLVRGGKSPSSDLAHSLTLACLLAQRELLPQGHPFDRNLSEIFEGLATNVDDLIYTEDKEISGLSKWRMILFLTHHQLIPQHPACMYSGALTLCPRISLDSIRLHSIRVYGTLDLSSVLDTGAIDRSADTSLQYSTSQGMTTTRDTRYEKAYSHLSLSLSLSRVLCRATCRCRC